MLAGTALAKILTVDAFAADDAQQSAVETVVVTGSHIPQTELTSSSPVKVVDRREIELEGITRLDDLLNNLPSVTADQGRFQTSTTTGIATVDLRDLGSQRTLVLIDGKRLMPGDPTMPVADLNQIPAAMVDHVEVLTGGASATYGSDALAGAVNFILRKDFEGVEIDGTYSAAVHDNGNPVASAAIASAALAVSEPPSSVWDAETADINLLMGANSDNGRGHIVAYAGYRRTAGLQGSQRDYTACPLQSVGGTAHGFACSGSLNSPVGFLFGLDGFNGPFRTTSSGDLAPFVEPRDDFNFAPFVYLQRPDTRWSAGWFGHYEVHKSAEVYGSMMFMDDSTVVQDAPSGWFAGVGPLDGAMAVNCDNPFLGSAADPNSPESIFCTDQGLGPQDNAHLIIGRRLLESGDREEDLRHTSYRLVSGIDGEIAGGWTYDIYAQYGRSGYQQAYLNDASVTREQNALDVVLVNGVPTCKAALSGADPACVPADIFQLGQLTPAASRYLSANGFQAGGTTEEIVSASLTGDLGFLGMKSPFARDPVALALGAEYRDEALQDAVSSEFATGDLAGAGGAIQSVTGRFDVADGFGEVRAPLVQNVPLAELLQLDAAYRYSGYSTAGPLTTYKFGAEWQPIDAIRFRASYQRAARAPNVLELFTPQSFGGWFSGNGGDPCGTDRALTQAQCDRTNGGRHLAGYGTPLLDCPNQSCSSIVGGSALLKPELGTTRSLGIVLTPQFLEGFSATIDYFDIAIANVIGVFPQSVVLDACGASENPYFCDMIHRAPGTGILYGTSGFVDSRNRNAGDLQSRGIDFAADYEADLAAWGVESAGTLNLDMVGTWTLNHGIEPVPAAALREAGIAPPYSADCAGLFGLVCGTALPSWRHKIRATWTSRWGLELSAQWRHDSSVRFDADTSNPILDSPCGGPCGDAPDARIGAYDYFDFTVSWTLNPITEIRAGVDNILDTDPPLIDSTIVGAPLGYDLLGRTIFVAYTIKT